MVRSLGKVLFKISWGVLSPQIRIREDIGVSLERDWWKLPLLCSTLKEIQCLPRQWLSRFSKRHEQRKCLYHSAEMGNLLLDAPKSLHLIPRWILSVAQAPFLTLPSTKYFLKESMIHCHRNKIPMFLNVHVVTLFYTCSYCLSVAEQPHRGTQSQVPDGFGSLNYWMSRLTIKEKKKQLETISSKGHNSQPQAELFPSSCMIKPTKKEHCEQA